MATANGGPQRAKERRQLSAKIGPGNSTVTYKGRLPSISIGSYGDRRCIETVHSSEGATEVLGNIHKSRNHTKAIIIGYVLTQVPRNHVPVV